MDQNQIYTIYDRISKRCLSLSKHSTINLINGLFNKNYSLNSEVVYNWTEHTADDLKRTLADTIITINRTDSFHMEIQMYSDGGIIFRVFEYGYRHALTAPVKPNMLRFPEPQIIYLYEDGHAPDFQELTIDFGSQGQFIYRVPTFKYLDISLDELNRRKLIVLIPFQLLKLRKSIEKKRTPENLSALKKLICNDIIGAIEANETAGNITRSEGRKLRRMTLQLYRHIYQGYKEMEESGMNEIAEEALVLDIDIIEHEHKKEIEALVLDIDIIEHEHKKEIEALVLDIDIIEHEHKKEIEALVLDSDMKEHEHKKEIEALVLDSDMKEQEYKKEIEAKVQELKSEEQKIATQLKINLALKLLLKGQPDSEITEATGLTQDELNQLKEE